MNVMHLDHNPRPVRDEAWERECAENVRRMALKYPSRFPQAYKKIMQEQEQAG